MAYLCHAEQRGRMTAAAITSDILCKNECPIQGHTFLPNNKNGIMLFHIMMMSMKTAWKWESVNLSSMEKRKVSTFLANEEKKRLLKSGKDKLPVLSASSTVDRWNKQKNNITAFHLKRDRVLDETRPRFKKRRSCFKKRRSSFLKRPPSLLGKE